MNGFNLEQLCDQNLELRTRLIVMACADSMLNACRAALLMGTSSDELRDIVALVDLPQTKIQHRIQVDRERLEEINSDAVRAIELLKAPVVAATQ